MNTAERLCADRSGQDLLAWKLGFGKVAVSCLNVEPEPIRQDVPGRPAIIACICGREGPELFQRLDLDDSVRLWVGRCEHCETLYVRPGVEP